MNREELKKHMVGFHKWMLKHDTADYAEQYFHYSDEDMAEEYLREVSPQDVPAYRIKEDKIDDLMDTLHRIDETPEERAYRRGWMNGYDEGLYDKEYK